jgi:hypothetical protein
VNIYYLGLIGLALFICFFVTVIKIVSINEPTNHLEQDLEDYENKRSR